MKNNSNQLTIDFNNWEYDEKNRQGVTAPSAYDARSIAIRADINAGVQSDNMLYYISFGSGSSGNSCYIGTRKMGIIVDAGIKSEFVIDSLVENGIKIENIHGICLTHDHADHVKYAYNLVRKHKHMRVYCTNRVVNGMLRKHNVSKRIKDYHNPIFKEIPFKIGDFEITAFDVPHDGTDNMGFSITYHDKTFVIATDLGAVTERAHHYMSQANYLVIEANYDKHMLLHGPYPEHLKSRIQTENGHMDNNDTAKFLSDIYSPKLKYIFLCHLSNDNNTPQLARDCVYNALTNKNIIVGAGMETIDDRKADVQLVALPRLTPTRLFVFR